MKRIFLFFLFLFFVFSSVWATVESKVYFSPQGDCQPAVISQINRAQKTIDIAMYDLTSRPIAEEIIRAHRRHVMVRLVLDRSQRSRPASKSRLLASDGCAVRVYQGQGLMHNKFAVIDGQVLLTGSFNWTASAQERNEENLLVISNQELAAAYEKRFEYLYRNSDSLKASPARDNYRYRPLHRSLSPLRFF